MVEGVSGQAAVTPISEISRVRRYARILRHRSRWLIEALTTAPGAFAHLYERGLLDKSQAKRAYWSAHRADVGVFYLLAVAALLLSVIDKSRLIPFDSRILLMLIVSILLILVQFSRIWGARYAPSRIHLQVRRLLDNLEIVDLIGRGDGERCRIGNPERITQLRIRALRWGLQRAAATVPEQFQMVSGRGHQWYDNVTRDKLRAALLQAALTSPVPAASESREQLRELLAAVSAALLEPDPDARLLPHLRSSPTVPAAAAPIRTWSWRWHRLTPAVALSVLVAPVLALVASRFSEASTTSGLLVAGAGTAAVAAFKYLDNRAG